DNALALVNLAPGLTIECLQLCFLKRHNLPIRITNLAGLSPRNEDLGRVNTEPRARRHLSHLGANQRKDTRGITAGHVAQRRWQYLSRLFQGAAGLFACSYAISRNGLEHASRHLALAQEPAHGPRCRSGATRRM